MARGVLTFPTAAVSLFVAFGGGGGAGGVLFFLFKGWEGGGGVIFFFVCLVSFNPRFTSMKGMFFNLLCVCVFACVCVWFGLNQTIAFSLFYLCKMNVVFLSFCCFL